MNTRILKNTFLVFLAVIFCAVSYFLGHRNATNEVARNYSSGALMFFTGIHENLVAGNWDGAKRIAACGDDCQILAIDNVERYPLVLQFWSMFPYGGMSDTKAMRDRELTKALNHFSKHPETLSADAMAYLNKKTE